MFQIARTHWSEMSIPNLMGILIKKEEKWLWQSKTEKTENTTNNKHNKNNCNRYKKEASKDKVEDTTSSVGNLVFMQTLPLMVDTIPYPNNNRNCKKKTIRSNR